jgi:methyl-accepting chemotaxis protein
MKLHRRRKYLINRSLQLRYALYIFGILLTVSLASTACLSFGMWDKVEKEFSSSSLRNRLQIASQISDYNKARIPAHIRSHEKRLADYEDVELLSARDKEILRDSIQYTVLNLTIKIFFLVLIIGIGTVLLTHKVAGPLFRFQQTFREIKNGKLKQRIYLRKDDHAHDILPHLNAMLGSLDYSFSKLKVLSSLVFDELDARGVSSENLDFYKDEMKRELQRYETSDTFKI